MADIAISVEGLSKRYLLDPQLLSGDGLRHVLQEKIAAPLRWLRGGKKQALTAPKANKGPVEFWALRDLSFEIPRGEVVGIVGRNGAGKSTLLKVLSRITEPTKGRITIEGRVASLLEVGTGFHHELTGRENIFLNGAILGMSRHEIRAKLDEIVAFAEVERFLDTPVKRYSSGMYVRLAFAVAAHLEPEILIIDEVLAVGDALFQEKCLGKMEQVATSGRTVLFVSHNANAVERLCTTALMLEAGQTVAYGEDVRGILRRYLQQEGAEQRGASWRNSGNEFANPWFKPLAFRLIDRTGQVVAAPIRKDEPVFVEIEAEVTQIDPSLTVGYCLYDAEGNVLYWSYHTDTAQPAWPQLRPGVCTLRSQLPAHILNEGAFRLELLGGLTHRSWLFEPGKGSGSLNFVIQGGLSDSPLWMEKRPGIVAPVIPWQLHETA